MILFVLQLKCNAPKISSLIKKISELRKNYNKQADLEVSKPGKEKPQICIGVVYFGAI